MRTLLLTALLACGTNAGEPTAPVEVAKTAPAPSKAPAAEPRVAMADADTLRAALEDASGHVRVFNFWATWCQPCIAELPHLAKLQQEYPDVEVILVSLDHRSIGTAPVLGFLKKQGLSLQSFMLDAEDPAMAMTAIYDEFPGAIPVTLVVDGDGDIVKRFHRGVTYADLTAAVGEAP